MKSWKLYFSDKGNAREFYLVFSSLVLVLYLFLNFLTYNESRSGYTLYDPVILFFLPRDLSVQIFVLTYGLSLAGLMLAFKKPKMFIHLLGSYVIMTVIRIFCLFVLPLEPPLGIIPLQDFFLKSSFYSGRENLRDLFFSGHTATLFLFAFVFPDKKIRTGYIIGGFAAGILLVIQHVHYSLDVIAAPAFAFFSVWIYQRFVENKSQ